MAPQTVTSGKRRKHEYRILQQTGGMSMKLLLTGAFGNIGQATLAALHQRGHEIRCFDVPTKNNQRVARYWQNRNIEITWGDLRDPIAVQQAVANREIVIHLAFVIPNLPTTGVGSENAPQRAFAINVSGAKLLIDSMKKQQPQAKLLFTSSLHVFGQTQHLPPPRQVTDPVHPEEHYSRHKVQVEKMVRESGLDWTIFRLGAAMPVKMIFDAGMFDLTINNRIEFVHRQDVARAIANALETEAVWGKLWLIGGGPRNQYIYRDLASKVLDAMGVGMLPDAAFSPTPYPTDWLDTTESQKVLNFQEHTLDDYVAELQQKLGWRRAVITWFRPAIRIWLLRRSPWYRQRKKHP
jgi:nucleoside-diphosphate-sugar epimerase